MLVAKSLILFLMQHWIHNTFCCREGDDVNTPNKVAHQRLNVVVIGATGSLAAKHLWQGFYQQFKAKYKNYEIHFYGSGRTPEYEAAIKFKTILTNSVQCDADTPSKKCSLELQEQFRNRVKYVQLKTSNHYKELCEELNRSDNEISEFCDKDSFCSHRVATAVEAGRIFYVAVPPFDYLYVTEHISRYCRPPNNSTWMRVAIEKPYGSCYAEVAHFTKALGKLFTKEEIYKADHFLWKAGVQHILRFRLVNKEVLAGIWSSQDVERIEVVMNEADNCKGRVRYYDQYGVVADVMQNHLTEVLLQIVTEPTKDGVRFQKEKTLVLAKLQPLTPQDVVHAQYDQYIEDARQETGDSTFTSNTATFAAARLHLRDKKWDQVPVFLVSGKELGLKATYVRIVFRDNVLCLPGAKRLPRSHCSQRQIIFVINHNIGLTHPTILVHKNIPGVRCPAAWNLSATLNLNDDNHFLDVNLDYYYACIYASKDNAYAELIKHLVQGQRRNFLSAEHVLESWRIWDDVIKSRTVLHGEVRKYNSSLLHVLDFVDTHNGLRFVD